MPIRIMLIRVRLNDYPIRLCLLQSKQRLSINLYQIQSIFDYLNYKYGRLALYPHLQIM